MRSTSQTILIVVGSIVAIWALITFIMYIGYSNSEIGLRQQIVAQQSKNEAVFDNTWKIINQRAGVATEYKEAFRENYADIMDSRYGEGGAGQDSMFLWIQEHNPEFSVELYRDLGNAIEEQRTAFTREQSKLIDLKREHDTLRTTFPASLFLKSRSEIEITVVTSSKTKEAFSTGEDNDVDLFNK